MLNSVCWTLHDESSKSSKSWLFHFTLKEDADLAQTGFVHAEYWEVYRGLWTCEDIYLLEASSDIDGM